MYEAPPEVYEIVARRTEFILIAKFEGELPSNVNPLRASSMDCRTAGAQRTDVQEVDVEVIARPARAR